MLPYRYRLPQITFTQKPRVITGTFLKMLWWENAENVSRFSVVVPKRIDKRAVYRNRLRRLVSQAIHTHLPSLRGGKDVRITLKTNPAQEALILEDTASLLKTAGLLP